MRIAIVNYYGTTPDMPGATKHYDMAVFFTENYKCDVEFWMSSVNYHTDTYIDGTKWYFLQHLKKLNNGLRLVYVKSIRLRRSRIRRELSTLIFAFISSLKILFGKKYDVVILSMPPVTPFCAWAAKIRNTKVIADVEDLWPLFLKESIHNKALLKYYDLQADSVYKLSSGIEAVSVGMLEYVKNKVNCNNKITWLAPLGVSLDLYFECKKVNFKKYRWNNDFIVMYVGAHGIANDLLEVIKTIAVFNNLNIKSNDERKISFIFIGDGGVKKELIQYLVDKNIDNVYFEDSIPSDLVPTYLKKADICLTNLKRIDSFKLVRPNKIFQYMAAKKPIICGICGEAERIVNESGAGICVDFTNHEQTAIKIRELIKSNDLKILGQKGFEYIKRNGDRKKIFTEFYENISRVTQRNMI